MRAKYLETAMTYHAAGLKVIPFYSEADGHKNFPSGYARYREAQTETDIRNLFNLPCDGIALLCTDGIEAIDIDTKHDPTGQVVAELTPLFERLEMPAVIQKTKSGGLHLIYRCNQPGVNQKLARREGCVEAMIETRGKVGYCLFTRHLAIRYYTAIY
ncbi:MAG: bifunctional DNA primase/polymerase [Saprospiraceae bacterium]|nr:bifunctional DNA primase/polymerase [Saprospiraceae bacterium]